MARLGGANGRLAPCRRRGASLTRKPLSEHHRVLSLAEIQTSFDFEPIFFGNVLLPVYDYTAHGDGSEFTLRRNRQAYDWVDILPARTPSLHRRSANRMPGDCAVA